MIAILRDMKVHENLNTNNLGHLQSSDPKVGLLSITSKMFLIADEFFLNVCRIFNASYFTRKLFDSNTLIIELIFLNRIQSQC